MSQNSQENTRARVSFLIKLQAPEACNFIKKETLARVFSSQFCEIFRNPFLTEHLRDTASAMTLQTVQILNNVLIKFINRKFADQSRTLFGIH